MKEIIIYEADDGKRFEDEEECVKYEERIIYDSRSVVMLDQDLNVLRVEDLGIEEWACRAMYIRIVNALSARKLFDYIISYYGVVLPENKGILWNEDIWAYNTDYDGWYNLTDKAKRIKELYERAVDRAIPK